jgi:vacuolar-type H+-ATPase subunit H
MAWQSILDRFRPTGAPGPVAPAGVPSQDATGPRTELTPVFAALAGDVAAADARETQALARSAALVEEARRRAATVLSEARTAAHRARLEAVDAARATAAADGAALTARARAAADSLCVLADADAVVARALATVLAHGEEPIAAGGAPGDAAGGVGGPGPARSAR